MSIRIPAWRIHFWPIADTGISTHQGIAIILTVTTVISLTIFLKRATLGLAIRAAAENFPVTQLMGIRANRVVATAFAISGLLADFVGFLWIAQRGSVDPHIGMNPTIKAFIAVIFGGVGSLSGAVAGGLILGFMEVGLRTYSSGRRTASPRCHRVHGGCPGIATLAGRPDIDPPKKRLSAHADSMTVL